MILFSANNPKFAKRLNTFRLFSEYKDRMLNTQNEIFHFQQCLGALWGQYFEKIEYGVIYWPRMTSLEIKFFCYLFWLSLN